MNQQVYNTSIPGHAREVVESRHRDGNKKTAAYFVAGENVGFREWFEDGTLFFEYSLRNGLKHGYEYRFHENGSLQAKETYRDGQLHGTQPD
jgi:antitoxin component YwqK of YwqJK toxin-antitoxin module